MGYIKKTAYDLIKSAALFCVDNAIIFLPLPLFPKTLSLFTTFSQLYFFSILFYATFFALDRLFKKHNNQFLQDILGTPRRLSYALSLHYAAIGFPLIFFLHATSLYMPVLMPMGFCACTAFLVSLFVPPGSKEQNKTLYTLVESLRKYVKFTLAVVSLLFYAPTSLSMHNFSLAVTSFLIGEKMFDFAIHIARKANGLLYEQHSRIVSIKPRGLASEMFQPGHNTEPRMVKEDEQVFSNEAGLAAHGLV